MGAGAARQQEAGRLGQSEELPWAAGAAPAAVAVEVAVAAALLEVLERAAEGRPFLPPVVHRADASGRSRPENGRCRFRCCARAGRRGDWEALAQGGGGRSWSRPAGRATRSSAPR